MCVYKICLSNSKKTKAIKFHITMIFIMHRPMSVQKKEKQTFVKRLPCLLPPMLLSSFLFLTGLDTDLWPIKLQLT